MSDNFHTPVSVDPRLLEIRDGVPIMLPDEARKLD